MNETGPQVLPATGAEAVAVAGMVQNPARPQSLFALARRVLEGSPLAVVGGSIVLFWIACAVFAPWIAPYPPNKLDALAMAYPYPTAAHWLGVDNLGRDILSRLIWGARTVLIVAPIAVLGATTLGIILGLLAGYRGGWTDALIMRIGDTLLAFPRIILYLIIIARFGASALNIILVVTLTAAPIIARIVRGVTLDVRNRDYVAAARMRGESTIYIMFVEILPMRAGR
jgi:peptide/nickel transport system permease protein